MVKKIRQTQEEEILQILKREGFEELSNRPKNKKISWKSCSSSLKIN